MTRLAGAGLALLCSVAVPATGQVRAAVDGGLGQTGTVSLAPALTLRSGPAHLELSGEYRDFSGLGPATIGRIEAGWLRPLGGPVIGEVTGNLLGQFGDRMVTAAAGRAGVRLHLAGRERGLWVGYQGGREYLGATRRWEAAAWRQVGRLSVQVQGWQTATVLSNGADSSVNLPDTLTPRTAASSSTRTITDLGLWLGWAGDRVSLRAATGMRFGPRRLDPGATMDRATPGAAGPTVGSTWWSLEGAWWIAARIGVVGTIGRQPIDPAYGASGEQFYRLGLRALLASRPRAPAVPAAEATPSLLARRMRESLVEFSLPAPERAAAVEIMGDFTDWQPVALERAGTRWRIILAVTPGLHRINVRYDGGAWQAPVGSRRVEDEFGGESGELLIR